MLKKFGDFSSVGVKLFIYFWLIIVITIAVTRLVSEQFKSQSIIVPTHQGDRAKLARITQKIQRTSAIKTAQVLAFYSDSKGRELLLKNIATQEVLSSDHWQLKRLKTFLYENNLDRITTVKLDVYRITGPITLTIDNTAFQLFLATRDRKPHLGNIINRMPIWLRLAIPIIISSILLWLLSRSLTKPLIAMQQAATRFGEGDFSTRVPITAQRNNEIGDCAVSFNSMAEKLEQNIGAHQRLLADVSHELRSPMTRLQIALGLAQQENINEALLHKHLQRCELEVARLDEMIENVLSLSRMENTISQIELMTVDLKQLLLLCIEDAQYIANEKLISIHFENHGTSLLQADANLLASAINNILINAIKYSPKNSQVTVKLTGDNRHYIIEIIDHGSGVPTEDLTKLFTPFFRVAHSRDRATGGTGLGLAIAKQAIVAHNGNIYAHNNSHNGLTVIIKLPLS
jgi:two-component system, OmpR family, sensor histidine kinase CpxA